MPIISEHSGHATVGLVFTSPVASTSHFQDFMAAALIKDILSLTTAADCTYLTQEVDSRPNIILHRQSGSG